MINLLSPEEEQKIRDQLINLGFVNHKDILQTVEGIIQSDGRREFPGVSMVDITSPDDLVYMLKFTKENQKDGWQLSSLEVSLLFDSVVRPEGVDVARKKYNVEEGPIPTKEKVTEEIALKVARIKMREQVQISPNLQHEFMNIGFYDLNQMLKKAAHHANLTYLRTDRPVELPFGNDKDKIDFEFIVISPPGNRQPYIGLIKAGLSTSGADGEKIKEQTQRTFYRINGGMPTMDHMIHQVVSGLELKADMFDRVRAIFKMDKTEGMQLRSPRDDIHKRPSL
jgi:hypothetical protein